MANWFYYNKQGEKIGPFSTAALKALVKQGLITRETVIANHTGRTAVAGEVNGLEFPEVIQPEPPQTNNTVVVPPAVALSPVSKDVYGLASTSSPSSGESNPFASLQPVVVNPFAAVPQTVANPFASVSAVSDNPFAAVPPVVPVPRAQPVGNKPAKGQISTTRRTIGLVCLIVFGLLFAVIIANKDTYRESSSPRSSPRSFPSLPFGSRTLDSYNRIQNGMSYNEVVAIVGKPTAEMADSEIPGVSSTFIDIPSIRTTAYMWEVSDSLGANFHVMFQNDKVVMKAQTGLK